MPTANSISHTQKPSLYQTSSLIEKARLSLKNHDKVRIAFLDIDATLTGDTTDTDNVREKLRDLGYATCFVTARVEESLMTTDQYKKSKEYGFKRPCPQFITDGKVCVEPESHMTRSLLNPDIIAGSTGTSIMVRQQNGGYKKDEFYSNQFGFSSRMFRKSALKLIAAINKNNALCRMSRIETEENYRKGMSDVFPPEYRIELVFETLQCKKEFKKRFATIVEELQLSEEEKAIVKTLKIVSDSHPKKNRFRAYILPQKADKRYAAERILDMICKELSIERNKIETLFAGDAFPDLKMGLYAGRGTEASFMVVGGSRLTSYLVQKELLDFAGEALDSIKQFLIPQKQVGYYLFQSEHFTSRRVILADLAYENTTGPQSILKYLS